MLQVVNVSLAFGGRSLFKNVNLKFTKGNCYGIIGANGAGKSTFLRILSKELEPNSGEVLMDKNERMSKLEQNQNKYDDYCSAFFIDNNVPSNTAVSFRLISSSEKLHTPVTINALIP